MVLTSFQVNINQIKAKQPYPRLHRGLIPIQTKLPFSFPVIPSEKHSD